MSKSNANSGGGAVPQDFENGFSLKVMVSTYLKGKAPAGWNNWPRFHRSFTPTTLSPRELAISIWKGYAFCPVYDGRRREECFKSAGHIAFDFDDGDETSSLPYLMKEGSFSWMFASFAYSTPSSTPETPKSRVVFILEKPIEDAQQYRNVYQALSWWITNVDGSKSDPQCKDSLRLYFGSPNCQVVPNWSILGEGSIAEVMGAYRQEHPPHQKSELKPTPAAPVDSDIVKQKKRLWLEQVELASKGTRHETLLKTARLLGGYIASGYYETDNIEDELLRAALKNTDEPEHNLMRTIKDGIAHGKGAPLRFDMPVQRLGDAL